MMRNIAIVFLQAILLLVATSCDNKQQATTAPAGNTDAGSSVPATPAGTAASPVKTQLLLDWHPEPEFGGFYAAQVNGNFTNHGLSIDIQSAGEGAAMWQLISQGKADFGTTAADQVLIARSQGADVVALFAVYQTSPQGVMVHKDRHFTFLGDVFNHPGTLEAEDDTWLHYCRKKFGVKDVKIISYAGGIGNFLAKKNDSQQCFITSEPILARAAGSDPQTFLIAHAGYNPYTTVVITRGDVLKNKPDEVKAMVAACREGWQAYLNNPSTANAAMEALNSDMDAATFTAAAAAQAPLIETDETKKIGLGMMTEKRWDELSKQLVDLDVIKLPIAAKDCFVDADKLP
jgi:NitT/TauT family transport system substrate-binding protein